MKSDKKSWGAEMLRLYFRNRYAPETEEKVQKWLAEKPETKETEQISKKYWDSILPTNDTKTYSALSRVNKKIGFNSQEKKIVWFRGLTRAAAIFILLIGISGVWFYLQHQYKPEIVVFSTSYGETKQVILPDKSVVWINAGSSLKYPSKFIEKNRSVKLKGEAFFSVTKDLARPFIVKTPNLSVKVLGTKFNLKAYPDDDQVVASLQEGKIDIQTAQRQHRELTPNEQLVYNNQTSTLKINKISSGDIPDWKNGNLLFSDATMGEILQTLKRHFNISFDIDQAIDLSTEHYTIKFERNENLEQILQVLTDVAGDFYYFKENGQMVLRKK
jgi:ferric-dicitrate binding protein FerR (iron transport regulator)